MDFVVVADGDGREGDRIIVLLSHRCDDLKVAVLFCIIRFALWNDRRYTILTNSLQ